MDKGSQENVTQQHIPERETIQGVYVLFDESYTFGA